MPLVNAQPFPTSNPIYLFNGGHTKANHKGELPNLTTLYSNRIAVKIYLDRINAALLSLLEKYTKMTVQLLLINIKSHITIQITGSLP